MSPFISLDLVEIAVTFSPRFFATREYILNELKFVRVLSIKSLSAVKTIATASAAE